MRVRRALLTARAIIIALHVEHAVFQVASRRTAISVATETRVATSFQGESSMRGGEQGRNLALRSTSLSKRPRHTASRCPRLAKRLACAWHLLHAIIGQQAAQSRQQGKIFAGCEMNKAAGSMFTTRVLAVPGDARLAFNQPSASPRLTCNRPEAEVKHWYVLRPQAVE